MMLKNVILFVNISLWSIAGFAADNQATEPKRIFQISYLKEVEDYKSNLNKSLEKLRLELTEKKYPQAYFIKSIQSQISEMNFRSLNDFKNLEEQLFSLLQSVNSQSNANKSLAHIRYDGDALHLPELSQLKKKFQNENEIAPTYVYSSPDSGSHTLWQKIQGTIKELSSRDESLIFVTVLAGYLFLLGRRKLGANKTNKVDKKLVKSSASVSSKTNTRLVSPSKNSNISTVVQVDLATLEGVAICRVNARDQIIYSNAHFLSSFGKQKVWRTFFNSSFTKDQRIIGATNLYHLQGETDSRYLVQVTEKESNGVKTVFLWDISWSANQQQNVQVPIRDLGLTFHDVIENALVKFQSLSKRMKIVGAEELTISEDSLDDIHLQKMTESFIKIIFQVANLKNANEEIVLKVDETEKRCLVSAFIPGIQLQPTDLNQKVSFGNGKNDIKTLNSIFRSMKTDHTSMGVEFKIKNVFNSKSSGLYLDLSFDKEIDVLPASRTEAQSLAV